MARRLEELMETVFPLVDAQDFESSSVAYESVPLYGPLRLLLDTFIVLLSLYIARRYLHISWHEHHLTVALVNILSIEIVSSFRNFYRPTRAAGPWQEIGERIFLWTVAFAGAAVVLSVTAGWPSNDAERQLALYWYALSFAGVATSQFGIRTAFLHRHAFGRGRRKAAFVGATETMERLAAMFQAHPRLGIDVVGCYDDRVDDWNRPLSVPRSQIAGNVDELLQAARAGEVKAIYVALPMEAAKRIKVIIERFAKDTTVSIHYCPTFASFDPINARFHDLLGQPVITVVESPFDGYRRYVKRLEDLLLSVLIVPAILPVMAIIAAGVKLTSPGPIFFRQTRNGLNGEPFKIWKFRTMYAVETDAEFVQATSDDPRITRFGRFLRDTSLDELPQFFNVLAGHMSVVGPRPAPVKYNDAQRQVVHRYMVRHKVKPGITGLAQVKGSRGETETIEKTELRTEYDLQYVKNWSIWLDIRILLQTLFVVFRQIPSASPRN
jgi:putative colanic acid biosysnthesis UDP-glucose lipid carrier transferase